MKLAQRGNESGIMLVEMMVYIATTAVLLAVVAQVFYRAVSNMRDLERNTETIAKVLRIGEQWREDVRASRGHMLFTNAQPVALCLDGPEPVCWFYGNRTVWRRVGEREPQAVLTNVIESAMSQDSRDHVKALRWDLELGTRKVVVRVKPLFQFYSVPTAPK